MTMIWATPAEVRAVWQTDWPALPTDDADVQRAIDSAARTLGASIIRWPVLDDTDRATDLEQRGHIVAAITETIRQRRKADTIDTELGGNGAAAVIAAGGSVTAGKLTVSGGSRTGGGAGAKIGDAARRPPLEAWEALSAAGLIGGSVTAW